MRPLRMALRTSAVIGLMPRKLMAIPTNVAAMRDAVPPALEDQLAEGGRLVAPIALGDDEQLVLVVRGPAGLERRLLDAVRFVPLR